MKHNNKPTIIGLLILAAFVFTGFGYTIGFNDGSATEPVTDKLILSEVDTIVLACLADAKENGLVMDVISVMSIDEITPEPFGNKWIDKTITACNDHLSILSLQLNEIGFYPLNQ